MKKIIVLLLALSSYCANAKPYEVGDVPFDLLGKANDGAEIKISDLKGKVVIVSFWASWCGPCRKELPALIGIQSHAKAGKLQIVSINIDEDRQIFKKIVKALDDTSIIWISDSNKRTARKYGVEGIPHMVIINTEGKVAAVHIGYGEAEFPTLVDEINAIARAKPAGG